MLQVAASDHKLEIYTGFLTIATVLANMLVTYVRDKSRRIDEDRRRAWDIQDRNNKARESEVRATHTNELINSKASDLSGKIDENTVITAQANEKVGVLHACVDEVKGQVNQLECRVQLVDTKLSKVKVSPEGIVSKG